MNAGFGGKNVPTRTETSSHAPNSNGTQGTALHTEGRFLSGAGDYALERAGANPRIRSQSEEQREAMRAITARSGVR
jgi:hypothetical protein